MVTTTATLAFDQKSARSFDADGRMRVPGCVISVAEPNPYYGKEIPKFKDLALDANTVYDLYRDPSELERAAPTFNGLPLMIRHIARQPTSRARSTSAGVSATRGSPKASCWPTCWSGTSKRLTTSNRANWRTCPARTVTAPT